MGSRRSEQAFGRFLKFYLEYVDRNIKGLDVRVQPLGVFCVRKSLKTSSKQARAPRSESPIA